MVVSFLDSQLTFCTLQHAARRRQQRRRAAKGAHGGHHHGHHGHHHDHSADSEYIILPRVRPSTKGGYEQYTRSWVFDVDGQGQQGQQGQGGNGASSSARYQQLDSHSHADKCRDAAAAAMASEGAGRSASRASTQRGDTYTIADAKALRAAIANGVPPDGLGSGSPGPSGPSGSRQYNRNQKHKELMREREHQKQLREQQQYQQRQQQHDKGVSGVRCSAGAVRCSARKTARICELARLPFAAPASELDVVLGGQLVRPRPRSGPRPRGLPGLAAAAQQQGAGPGRAAPAAHRGEST